MKRNFGFFSTSTKLEILAGISIAVCLSVSIAFAQPIGKSNSPPSTELLAQAAKGDALALYRLGGRYEAGNGVARDYTRAVELYSQSAEKNNAGAQFRLARLFEQGLGTHKDFSKAADMYRKAAMSDSSFKADAAYRLGKLYYLGLGVSQSYTEAQHWWSLSLTPEARFALGNIYYFAQGIARDYEKAVSFWRLSASKNYFPAQRNLAIAYSRGQGVPQNWNEAFFWIKVSSLNIHSDKKKTAQDLANISRHLNALQIEAEEKRALAWSSQFHLMP